MKRQEQLRATCSTLSVQTLAAGGEGGAGAA